MKFLLYTDNHFSKYSSILRTRGEKYSVRLENQIDSLRWAENIAFDHKCDTMVCLGDFFDSPSLDAEEISALQDIRWSYDINKVFLVGNHELGLDVNLYNSANLFNLMESNSVISTPISFVTNRTLVCLLPYVPDINRKPLKEYINRVVQDAPYDKVLVLSHNDILGAQYGGYVSKSGFDIQDIESNCDLFINGHIHNRGWIGEKILNLGNLTGQNFSENSGSSHGVVIIDTNNLSDMVFIPNPYAIYFYKVNAVGLFGNSIREHIPSEQQCVLSVSCDENNQQVIKNLLDSLDNVLCYRLMVEREKQREIETINDASFDHIGKFVDFIHKTVGVSKMIDEELDYILR